MTAMQEGKRGDLEFGTIPGLVRLGAERYGDTVAIEDGSTRLSYRKLAAEVQATAKAMLAVGVEHGDRVAIWAPNMWEWIVSALAAQSIGGVIVTVNTRYKGHEAAYLLNKSRAKILLTVTDFLSANYVEVLQKSGEATTHLKTTVILRGPTPAKAISWQEFRQGGATVDDSALEARSQAVQGDDLADIIFTSGTTGHPKGVMCTHAQNLRAFRDWADVTGLKQGDRYLIALPFFHSFGYKAGWLASLMMGATILPEPVFDVDIVLKRVAADRVSVLPGPPALYQTILARKDLDQFDLSSLRLSVTGAAAIPVSLIEEMRQRLSFKTIITGYGLSESTGIATMCRYDDDPETIATTSGRAIPDVDVQIVDDDMTPLPPNSPGEIVIRGYNIMKGYFEDAAQTADTITKNGWLLTGDIGTLDERGYIKITDRKKDMFIVGGFNAYPAEIESVMLKQGQIAQVAVVGMPDDRMGEVGCAFVVLKPGVTISEADLLAWCKDNMANYKVPRRIFFETALPANATGKVLKYELRQRVR